MRRFVAHDPSAKRLAQALVAEADAKDRDLSRQLLDRLVGNAGVVRRAGAGRNDDAVVAGQLGNGDLVIAEDDRLDPELAEVLDEVVRERVVVVDDRQLWSGTVDHHNSSAISIA